jgi:hypothetical protein
MHFGVFLWAEVQLKKVGTDRSILALEGRPISPYF